MRFEIQLINSRHIYWFEKEGEGYSLEMVQAKRYLCLVKGECAGYYNVLFKRRAAAPICIVLCVITIVCYAVRIT